MVGGSSAVEEARRRWAGTVASIVVSFEVTLLRGVREKKTNLAEKKRPPNFIDLASHHRQIWRPPDFISKKTTFGSCLERRISPKKKKWSGGFTAVTQYIKLCLACWIAFFYIEICVEYLVALTYSTLCTYFVQFTVPQKTDYCILVNFNPLSHHPQ